MTEPEWTVEWNEHRRICSDGSVVQWDRETLQWVLVADEPPTWDELRRLTDG